MTENLKSGRICKECGEKKFFQRFCVWCMRKTNSNIHIAISETITVRDSLRLRTERPGFKGFLAEIISGWFPTKGKLAEKLPHGVEKSRVVDRGKDEYHEVIKDYKTKKIIHECHEPLSQHKKYHDN